MKKKNRQNGFTLLEMLVSLGIFTIVAVIAVGALVRIVALNRQAQTLQSSMNNLSFALESMSREMRVGSDFHCETDSAASFWDYHHGDNLDVAGCAINAGALVAFKSDRVDIDSSGKTCRLVFAYRFMDVSGKRTLQKAQQDRCNDNLSTNSFTSVLDTQNITLTGGTFGVYIGPNSYAWTSIRMAGYSGTREKDKNFFDVQTSVSERLPD